MTNASETPELLTASEICRALMPLLPRQLARLYGEDLPFILVGGMRVLRREDLPLVHAAAVRRGFLALASVERAIT